ncbi:MAG: ABC transporter permease [Actinomycetota bacterium]
MDTGAVLMIWKRDLIVNWRDKGQLIGSLVRSVLWLVVLGLGLRAAFRGVGGVTFSEYIYAGIIGMTLLFAGVQSAISIVWEREFGFVRELLVAPISRSSITTAKILSGGTWALFQGIIILLLAPVVGVSLTPLAVVEALAVMALMAITFTSLGIVIASRIKTFQGFGVIANVILMPLFFLSTAIFPLPWLPDWLKYIMMANPLTYTVDALRAVTIGLYDFPFWFDLGITAALTAFFAALATLLFVKEI